MIELKPIYGEWIPVTKEKALDYARFQYKNIATMKDEELIKYINTKKIRGISFNEEELRWNK